MAGTSRIPTHSEDVNIVVGRPPVYDDIIAHGMHPHGGVIYTYGDTIYNPSGNELPDHLIEHEKTHMRQQNGDPDAWWSRYLMDEHFRIREEAEAYGRQYRYLCSRIKDRNRRAIILNDLSRHLASPVYGSVITHHGAMKLIRESAHL